MENIAIAIFLYFLLTIFSGSKKKKAPPPRQGIPPVPPPRKTGSSTAGKGVGFEIPHLEGAPPLPQSPPSDGLYREAQEAPTGTAEGAEGVFERNPWQEYAERTFQGNVVSYDGNTAAEQPMGQPEGKKRSVSLDPGSALQAIAMAEVLSRPKAYRSMQRYRR